MSRPIQISVIVLFISIVIWLFAPIQTREQQINAAKNDQLTISTVNYSNIKPAALIDTTVENHQVESLPQKITIPVLTANEENLAFLIDAYETTPVSLQPRLFYQVWRLAADLDTHQSAIVAFEYFSRAGTHADLASTYLNALNNRQLGAPGMDIDTSKDQSVEQMLVDKDANIRLLAIRQLSNRRVDNDVSSLLRASYDLNLTNRLKTLISLWQISMDNPERISETRDRFEQARFDQNQAISELALSAIKDFDSLNNSSALTTH